MLIDIKMRVEAARALAWKAFSCLENGPGDWKARLEIANTMKFFDRILTVFFERHIADSTSANPRFMKNTNAAVNKTQTVSIPTLRSAGV